MPTEKISSPSPFFQAHTKKSPKSQKIDPKDTCLSSQKKKRKENTGKFLPFFFPSILSLDDGNIFLQSGLSHSTT